MQFLLLYYWDHDKKGRWSQIWAISFRFRMATLGSWRIFMIFRLIDSYNRVAICYFGLKFGILNSRECGLQFWSPLIFSYHQPFRIDRPLNMPCERVYLLLLIKRSSRQFCTCWVNRQNVKCLFSLISVSSVLGLGWCPNKVMTFHSFLFHMNDVRCLPVRSMPPMDDMRKKYKSRRAPPSRSSKEGVGAFFDPDHICRGSQDKISREQKNWKNPIRPPLGRHNYSRIGHTLHSAGKKQSPSGSQASRTLRRVFGPPNIFLGALKTKSAAKKKNQNFQ